MLQANPNDVIDNHSSIGHYVACHGPNADQMAAETRFRGILGTHPTYAADGQTRRGSPFAPE